MHPSIAFVIMGSATVLSQRIPAYNPSVCAPDTPEHGKPLEAAGMMFLVGAPGPTVECPPAFQHPNCPVPATVVTANMNGVKASFPGGQFVYAQADGRVVISMIHHHDVDAGGINGGFQPMDMVPGCEGEMMVTWRDPASEPGAEVGAGLLLCSPSNPDLSYGATHQLYANTASMGGQNCFPIAGVSLHDADDGQGAIYYSTSNGTFPTSDVVEE